MTPTDKASASLRWSDRLQLLPPWLLAALVVASLAGCWVVVFLTGGSQTAWPHLFYVPVVLAALPFGVTGGLVTGLAAMLLCGPVMPLDVATGDTQELANWLTRGAFFMGIGAISGSTTGAMRRSFEQDLASKLIGELQVTAPLRVGPADAAWAARVRRMLETESFRSVFQPIYSLSDGELLAVEALTRFDTEPVHPPDVWFEHAHRADLGLDLELATLRSAFRASRELPPEVGLSFNVSPDLLVDPRLMELIDGGDERRLVVEITEHVVIDDYREVTQARAELRRRGVLVAVDDAGAGFASLRHIVMLQPDVIKLDPSLTQNLHDDPVRGPLADALLQFAARTDSRIVVEGIETASDLATWRDLGADAGQGYYLARPGPLPVPVRFSVNGKRANASSGVDATAR